MGHLSYLTGLNQRKWLLVQSGLKSRQSGIVAVLITGGCPICVFFEVSVLPTPDFELIAACRIH